ncbi:hypothetical protein B0H16DRAFT_1712487 [Mycena metata]|uniref:Uncharacterized protein n=1 Tax=Mycena metata TaxID=1033252 RepID=A0AAD7K2Z5_9AGAR|nr:hypothetical protein B0H16DRAFT_1740001 [Mycena metata]KAJ7776103.1 hypothetical protein B0H16DRAFT_1712487 [Mycena metata]
MTILQQQRGVGGLVPLRVVVPTLPCARFAPLREVFASIIVRTPESLLDKSRVPHPQIPTPHRPTFFPPRRMSTTYMRSFRRLSAVQGEDEGLGCARRRASLEARVYGTRKGERDHGVVRAGTPARFLSSCCRGSSPSLAPYAKGPPSIFAHPQPNCSSINGRIAVNRGANYAVDTCAREYPPGGIKGDQALPRVYKPTTHSSADSSTSSLRLCLCPRSIGLQYRGEGETRGRTGADRVVVVPDIGTATATPFVSPSRLGSADIFASTVVSRATDTVNTVPG